MPGSARIVLNRFKSVSVAVKGQVGRAVRDASLDLLSLGVNRAPVAEGTLRGSGTAHFDGARIATGAEFGGEPTDEALNGGAGSDSTNAVVAFNTVYAHAQHERTDFAHPKGGEAKYLERPLEENRQRYLRRIREAAARGLKGR